MTALKFCRTCKYMNKRPAPRLFSDGDLQSPGILKAQTELDQETRQRAQLEMQRHAARQPFDYEPHHFEWCAKFTRLEEVARANEGDQDALARLMQEGGAHINPVSGVVTPLYILCAWKNETGNCEAHEPR
jgi:alpha-D-ribose 1-methylphosphonate 5-triphosphate synthase subunit PhnI